MALFYSACESFQIAGEFAAGRGEFLAKAYETAFAHFEKVARANPDYVFRSMGFSESVWTYLGRCQYHLSKLGEARRSLERAVEVNGDDSLARMFLGLTLLRQGEEANGLRVIEGGLHGLHNWIDDENERNSSKALWDPCRDIRNEIANALSMISDNNPDRQELIENVEWIGQKTEDEIDEVRRQEWRAHE